MEIRDLMFFEVLAEESHWGRAAERLGRTKPALTKCIRRLEQEIGAPLFHRVGRRTSLTQAGAALAVHARHMHLAMTDALKNISDLATGLAGHVRIGMGTTIVDYLLPKLCSWFLEQSPEVTIDVRIGHGDVLRADLLEGKLDGIVTSALHADDDQFTKQNWFTDEVVVVARRRHPLAGKQIRLEDLTHYDWVLPSQAVASRQWIDWVFKSHGLPAPRVRAEVSSGHLVSTFVEKSNMLSFTSRRSLRFGGMGTRLTELPLKETTMTRTLSFLYRKNAYVPPTLSRLAEILRRSGTPPIAGPEGGRRKTRATRGKISASAPLD